MNEAPLVTTYIPAHTLTWAKAELDSIARAAKYRMKASPPAGNCEGNFCQSLWDEYCWVTQNDGYDHEITIGALSLGSFQDAYSEATELSVTAAIEARSRSVVALLSQYAVEHGILSDDAPEDFRSDEIWMSGIIAEVIEILTCWASDRNLDPIGPERAYWLQTEVSWGGHLAEVLSYCGRTGELIEEYADDLLDKSSDLNAAAEACVEAYLTAAGDCLTNAPMGDFIDMFGEDLRPTITLHAMKSLAELRTDAIAARDACD